MDSVEDEEAFHEALEMAAEKFGEDGVEDFFKQRLERYNQEARNSAEHASKLIRLHTIDDVLDEDITMWADIMENLFKQITEPSDEVDVKLLAFYHSFLPRKLS